jgi:hypothetical protein
MNPYESPAVVSNSTQRISYGRMAFGAACSLPSPFLVLLAFYGAYNLHSRGWPHPTGRTIAILAALGMFLLGAFGFACFGWGTFRRKWKLQFMGIVTLVTAALVYSLLYWVAN